MISIAHPDFRDDLEREARENGLMPKAFAAQQPFYTHTHAPPFIPPGRPPPGRLLSVLGVLQVFGGFLLPRPFPAPGGGAGGAGGGEFGRGRAGGPPRARPAPPPAKATSPPPPRAPGVSGRGRRTDRRWRVGAGERDRASLRVRVVRCGRLPVRRDVLRSEAGRIRRGAARATTGRTLSVQRVGRPR